MCWLGLAYKVETVCWLGLAYKVGTVCWLGLAYKVGTVCTRIGASITEGGLVY